ncbi:MAG TPA: hypothetical protein VII93_12580 [Anaerolineales bacterium]
MSNDDFFDDEMMGLNDDSDGGEFADEFEGDEFNDDEEEDR